MKRSAGAVPRFGDGGRHLLVSRGTLRRALGLLWPYRWRVAAVLAVILAGTGLGVAEPLLVRHVFDHGLFPDGGVRFGVVARDIVLIVVVTAAAGGLALVETSLTAWTGQNVMHDLRTRLYGHLQRQSVAFFTARRGGQIQARLTSDVEAVHGAIAGSAPNAVANAAGVLAATGGMVVLSWRLALASAVIVPGYVWVTRRVGRRRQQLTARVQEVNAELTAASQETLSLSGVVLARTFGRADDELARYRGLSGQLNLLRRRQEVSAQGFVGLVQSSFALMPVMVYLVAGYVLWRDPGAALTAGTLIAFTGLQARLYLPVGQLLRVGVDVQSALVVFERIFDDLDLVPQTADRPDALALPRGSVRGDLSFEGVGLHYRGEGADGPGRAALAGVSLRISPGQFVAVVGPSGAGKSSLAQLATRLYEPTSGTVRFDGHDVRELRSTDLTDAVCLVSQETYLFHGTVAENLRYARADATNGDLVEACRAAGVHEVVAALPTGYATVVGERGHQFSGGERQRLALARALLRRPQVLILDEATSALDALSEQHVQSTLARTGAGRTTVVIAHRLSTIRHADVIYVLDRGRLVEHGDHRCLLAAGGLYARLYAEQNRTVGTTRAAAVAGFR